MVEKFDLVLELLTDLQTGQREFRQEVNARLDRIDVRLDGVDVRLDRIDARLDALEALAHQLARRVDGLTRDVVGLRREAASLRQTITEYHGSVLGHGVLLTELEERLARVERHLDLRS